MMRHGDLREAEEPAIGWLSR